MIRALLCINCIVLDLSSRQFVTTLRISDHTIVLHEEAGYVSARGHTREHSLACAILLLHALPCSEGRQHALPCTLLCYHDARRVASRRLRTLQANVTAVTCYTQHDLRCSLPTPAIEA